MYLGLNDPALYLYGLFFLIASFFSWFIPGWVLLSFGRPQALSLKLFLTLPLGIALWGIQGYLFGYAHLRLLTFAYVAFFAWLFFHEQHLHQWADFKKLWAEFRKQPLWLIAAIVLSSLVQIFAQVSSGLRIAEGITFYFVNSADGIMHLAYIQELAQRFPPQEPGAIGLSLVNYHYWSDLVLADLHRVWQIPVMHLFFQYIPLLISVWTMLLVVHLIRYLGGNHKAMLVSLFLFALGGDAAYLITLALHGTWAEKIASLDSGVTFIFNTPQVFARLVFLGSIFFTLEWWKQRNWRMGIFAAILIASLCGFKVYYAIYAVVGFCSLVAFEWGKTFFQYLRKNPMPRALQYTFIQQRQSLLLVCLLAVLCLTIYLPVNSAAGGLRYSFFEWPHRFLSSENIDYADWFLRMQVYEASGNIRNIFIFNLWAAFLTFVAVYGTRMLGMLPLFRTRGQVWSSILMLFLPVNILFILLGLLTLQTSGGLNVFNFLIVPIVSFNIFAAFSLAQLPNKFFALVFVLFILLTLPRSGLQFVDYAQRYHESKIDLVITNEELEAFEYLQKNTNSESVVQGLVTEPQNRLSLSIPYFSNRDAYILGVTMLNSHNQPTKERIENLSTALAEPMPASKAAALRNLGIDYLFIPTKTLSTLRFEAEPVFQNSTISILEIP